MKRRFDIILVGCLLILTILVIRQQYLLQNSWSREEEMAVLANRLDIQLFQQRSIAKDWELAALNYKAAAETFRQAAYFCVTPAMGDAPGFELSK